MAKNDKTLIIVESPSKAQTIEGYLSSYFKGPVQVISTLGIFRDLVPKKGSIDTENNFEMRYEIIDKSKKQLTKILSAMKGVSNLLLATDPDREGEAISWHLLEVMQQKNKLDNCTVKRIVFHAITKAEVIKSIENPRDISYDLVHAQQARRALDYMMGFNLSPLLWKTIRTGLSAGRVQSPALRLIIEREDQINAFVKVEYWSIHAQVDVNEKSFKAQLIEYDNKKLAKLDIGTQDQAKTIEKKIKQDANGKLLISKVEKKKKKRQPSAPFMTSTLQQEASRKLGFSSKRTMSVAQQLYEGVDIKGSGKVGLITYMRTDSTHIIDEAVDQLREQIKKTWGSDYVPQKRRVFKKKQKNAQEAHEAIRPTLIGKTPQSIQSSLSIEQFKLYDLIWKKSVASQMVDARINTVRADLTCPHATFKATGSSVEFPGFMAAYLDSTDDKSDQSQEDQGDLPSFNEGQVVNLQSLACQQHFTEPPARYSEASLVKALEDFGIGRPSTYASIISTLLTRQYVTLDKKRFFPTVVSHYVIKFLSMYFDQYVDYTFTAKMEDDLDAISRGEKNIHAVLQSFWKGFDDQIKQIEKTVSRKDVTEEPLEELCPSCKKSKLVMKFGRNGQFIACSGYPDCQYTRNIDDDPNQEPDPNQPKKPCPLCQHDLVIKNGRYGQFYGCSQYPNCKHIEPLVKLKVTDVTCPKCQQGKIVEKRSKKGPFYACNAFPKCRYIISNEPVAQTCPSCQWPILMKRHLKSGSFLVCPQKACDYKEKISDA